MTPTEIKEYTLNVLVKLYYSNGGKKNLHYSSTLPSKTCLYLSCQGHPNSHELYAQTSTSTFDKI